MSGAEIRFYKGKHKVTVLQKSKGNWLVRAEEPIPRGGPYGWPRLFDVIRKGEVFTAPYRLLWRTDKRKQRKPNSSHFNRDAFHAATIVVLT